MARVEDVPDGDDALGRRPPGSKEETKTLLTPGPEHAKHWAKMYRTGIASGASSVLSTVTAVSYPVMDRMMTGAKWTAVPVGLGQNSDASV